MLATIARRRKIRSLPGQQTGRNVFSNFGASLRLVFGGEARGYTQLLTDSRNQATERLKLAAMEKGANAVIAMRFDCNEIASLMSEIAAYGTAVIVRRK